MKRILKNTASALMALLWMVMMSQCDMGDSEVFSKIDPGNSKSIMNPDVSSSNTYCSTCDHVVDSYITDGKELGFKPGDVICLDANVQYGRLVFRNIIGTHNEPIIIRNCGGVAKIYSTSAFGIKFEDSEEFRLTGDGTPGIEYGIRVTTEKGFYVTMEHFTTKFEISNVEIAGASANGIGDKAGFAGIGVKTSPYEDCELFTDHTRQAWVMRNVIIRNNYIHDTGGEGIYMGHGFYTGRKENKCPDITYSHSIRWVRIHDNLIENIGYDGIQIKNANQQVEVFKNVVRNFGTKGTNAHNEGLFIGEGTNGKFYDNIIDTGSGNGCQVQGLGNLDIYNNLFINCGENGIYATHGQYVKRYKDGYFNFFNNTIYNSTLAGFVFYNEDGGIKRFKNNLVVKAGTLIKKGSAIETANNLTTNDVSSVKFANINGRDFHVNLGSPAIDKGLNLSSFGITNDIEGTSRPRGKGYDIGAFECR